VGTGLTGGGHRSDRCAMMQLEDFEVEDTHRDRMSCVEAMQGAVAGHPSDGSTMKIPKVPLGACILVLGLRGSFVCRLPPYNPSGEKMEAISWNPSTFVLLFSSSIFPLEFLGLAWELHGEIL
jgi:hypothetical protein